MTGMTGIELAKEARARAPGLGIVVVSGFSGDIPMQEMERLAARFVAKPFRAEELNAAVAAATSAPRPS
jgi:FixJ family two-component response regulator